MFVLSGSRPWERTVFPRQQHLWQNVARELFGRFTRKSDPVKLNIRIGNSYIPVLSIPVDDCRRFALRLRSRLTFLRYTISGARGHISATPSGNEVDYRLDVNEGEQYYFSIRLHSRCQ